MFTVDVCQTVSYVVFIAVISEFVTNMEVATLTQLPSINEALSRR